MEQGEFRDILDASIISLRRCRDLMDSVHTMKSYIADGLIPADVSETLLQQANQQVLARASLLAHLAKELCRE